MEMAKIFIQECPLSINGTKESHDNQIPSYNLVGKILYRYLFFSYFFLPGHLSLCTDKYFHIDLARATPPTLLSDTEVHDEVDRSRGVRKETRQLDVSTSLTWDSSQTCGLYLGGLVEEGELVHHEHS